MNEIDDIFSSIILKGEHQCAKGNQQRNPWSPQLRLAGKTLTYWKKKWRMSQQKSFIWNRINMLASEIKLPEWDHNNEEAAFIKQKYREARKNWKTAKRQAPALQTKTPNVDATLVYFTRCWVLQHWVSPNFALTTLGCIIFMSTLGFFTQC
jgi:hypothetical protein